MEALTPCLFSPDNRLPYNAVCEAVVEGRFDEEAWAVAASMPQGLDADTVVKALHKDLYRMYWFGKDFR